MALPCPRKILPFLHKDRYNTRIPYYDEIFKHVTGEFPRALAALTLKISEVEIGKRPGTEHTTIHFSEFSTSV